MGNTRWIKEAHTRAEVPEIDAFIAEILSVCKRHGLSISHEDGHGAFEIEDWDPSNEDWLGDAHDARKLGRPKHGWGCRKGSGGACVPDCEKA